MTAEERDRGTAPLDLRLVELGPMLSYPRPRDLAPAVRRRLEESPVRPLRDRPARRAYFSADAAKARRGLIPAIAAAALLATFLLAASPTARKALAGWLGLRGVQIHVTPSRPTAPVRTLGEGLQLGQRMTLDQAKGRVAFPILMPSALGQPDEVYLGTQFASGQVFLMYRARPGLPTAAETGAGLLVAQFRAGISGEHLHKLLGPGTKLESVRVNGHPGFWIEGSHELYFEDEDGLAVPDTVRLAGNVLLWEQGSVTIRLESALSKKDALRVAASLQ